MNFMNLPIVYHYNLWGSELKRTDSFKFILNKLLKESVLFAYALKFLLSVLKAYLLIISPLTKQHMVN